MKKSTVMVNFCLIIFRVCVFNFFFLFYSRESEGKGDDRRTKHFRC